MKKVLLALSLAFSASVVAQSENVSPSPESLNPALMSSQAEVLQAEALINKKVAASKAKAKTSGGLITNAFIGYADSVVNFYGSAVNFGSFQIPLYQDSSVRSEFSNVTNYVDQHAFSNTYDATSLMHGVNTFASVDDYTIDSVFILGSYRAPSSITNPTGDSLIMELIWSPRSDQATWGGVYWAPNASNPDTCFATSPLVTVNGLDHEFSGTNRIRVAMELTGADLVDSASQTLFGFEVNQLIPAGNLVAVSFNFKSAHAYNANDIYFSTVSQNNTAGPNFSARTFQESGIAGSPIRYFCDPFGRNGSNWLYNTTLYQTWSGNDAWRNGRYSPDVISGHRIFYMVSGISTLGVDENDVTTQVGLYPNPSNGTVNIELSERGTYAVEVMNMIGQIVYTEEVSVNANETVTRDFSNLNNGVYLVNIKGDNNFSHSSKLTINK